MGPGGGRNAVFIAAAAFWRESDVSSDVKWNNTDRTTCDPAPMLQPAVSTIRGISNAARDPGHILVRKSRDCVETLEPPLSLLSINCHPPGLRVRAPYLCELAESLLPVSAGNLRYV